MYPGYLDQLHPTLQKIHLINHENVHFFNYQFKYFVNYIFIVKKVRNAPVAVIAVVYCGIYSF